MIFGRSGVRVDGLESTGVALDRTEVARGDPVVVRQVVVRDGKLGEPGDVVGDPRPLTARGVPNRYDDLTAAERVQRVSDRSRVDHAGSSTHPVADREGVVRRSVRVAIGAAVAGK